MSAQRYHVERLEDSEGTCYRLDGPGLQMQRLFRSDGVREHLADMAELMNFAFDQGRRVLDLHRQSIAKDDCCADGTASIMRESEA